MGGQATVGTCSRLMGILGGVLVVGCGWCPAGTQEVRQGMPSLMELQEHKTEHLCRLPDGQPHGPYEILREDGSRETEGHFFEGRECGTWISYGPGGEEVSREERGPCGSITCPDARPGCQDEMIDLGRLSIDRYEASRFDATECSAGSDEDSGACSQAGVLPWSGPSYLEARAACERVGKRPCTLEEWRDACDGQTGEGGTLYPFGDSWNERTCNIWDPDEEARQGILPTGAKAGCRTPDGVFDLAGNVWEYVDSDQVCEREPCAWEVGGDFQGEEGSSRCAMEPSMTSPSGGLAGSGFRCCR